MLASRDLVVSGSCATRDQDLFADSLDDRCVSFLRHVFTLHEVDSVELDRKLSIARIHYDVARFRLPEFLPRLAMALRGSLPPHADPPSNSLARDLAQSTGPIRIQRFGTFLTTWEIIANRPGRIRLRHRAIYRNTALANQLQGVIANFAGVIACTVWPVTGSVLIRFDPNWTSATRLLAMLDHARCSPGLPQQVAADMKSAGFGLANSSLALAVAGELAAPFLLPASALLLVGSNLRTFRDATRQLLRGQLGLPVLYTSVIAVALVSGQFIAPAAMSWMLTFWSSRYRNDLMNALAQAAWPDYPSATSRQAGHAGGGKNSCRAADRGSQAQRCYRRLGRGADPRGWTHSPGPRIGRRADDQRSLRTFPQTA